MLDSLKVTAAVLHDRNSRFTRHFGEPLAEALHALAAGNFAAEVKGARAERTYLVLVW